MFRIYVLTISTDKPVGEFYDCEEGLKAEEYLVGIFGKENVLSRIHKEKSDIFDEEWKRNVETIEHENLSFCHIEQEWMPCKMTSSLKQSLNVVNLLQHILPKAIPTNLYHKDLDAWHQENMSKTTNDYYYVQAYQNDVEQGFTVSALGFCFYICENRNSSVISFYRGDFADPHGIGILAYNKGSKWFKSPKECAETIARAIQQFYGFDESLLVL